MAIIENSYLGIANSDYLFVTTHRDPDYRNNSIMWCEQVIEKLLKSVIELTVDNDELLRSNDLKSLYDSISNIIKLEEHTYSYLSTITNLYLCTQYPNDNFINVSEQDEDECFKVMNEVYRVVNDWHTKYNN